MMLLHTKYSNYIYYKFKVTLIRMKGMANNSPLSTQIGLFPDHLKKEAGIVCLCYWCVLLKDS
jgi:hypothetical protein